MFLGPVQVQRSSWDQAVSRTKPPCRFSILSELGIEDLVCTIINNVFGSSGWSEVCVAPSDHLPWLNRVHSCWSSKSLKATAVLPVVLLAWIWATRSQRVTPWTLSVSSFHQGNSCHVVQSEFHWCWSRDRNKTLSMEPKYYDYHDITMATATEKQEVARPLLLIRPPTPQGNLHIITVEDWKTSL